ncbi:MAG: gluconokinase [Gemmatimonadaceae bacterium]
MADARRVAAIVVMGVAGAGKTAVGRSLARTLGWSFLDADDFHPIENVERMQQGIPLADADRTPWLEALRSAIAARVAAGEHVVLACSALRQAYRDVLASSVGEQDVVHFVYLRATADLIAPRLARRRRHFFPPALLASQLEALEEPDDALWLDASRAPEDLVRQVARHLALGRFGDGAPRGN